MYQGSATHRFSGFIEIYCGNILTRLPVFLQVAFQSFVYQSLLAIDWFFSSRFGFWTYPFFSPFISPTFLQPRSLVPRGSVQVMRKTNFYTHLFERPDRCHRVSLFSLNMFIAIDFSRDFFIARIPTPCHAVEVKLGLSGYFQSAALSFVIHTTKTFPSPDVSAATIYNIAEDLTLFHLVS